MKTESVLEEAWNELLVFYKNGHTLLNEEDTRCLLYHLCAKRLADLNRLHSEKRIDGTRQETYDLIVDYPEKGHGIAVELKCWLWRSSGTGRRDYVIRDQLRRLEGAVKSGSYDQAYLFVLDEFGLPQSLLRTLDPGTKEVRLRYFSPICMKARRKWKFEYQEPCSNCDVKTPCKSNQEYIRKWQSKGYLS